jgi:hypothetical protein
VHLDTARVVGDGKRGDQLGVSVAVGDLDGDPHADVAAGIVGKDVGPKADAGSLLVLRGSATGVTNRGSRHLHEDGPGVAGVAQVGDRLGSGVAIGDVDGDAIGDLVAGLAGQDVGAATAAGAVLVLPGASGGVTGAGSRELNSGGAGTGLADIAETGDVLGAAIAVGELDGDDQLDLVLGAPGEDVPGARDGGAVVLVTATASAAFHGDTPGVVGDAERRDRWGGLFPIYLR